MTKRILLILILVAAIFGAAGLFLLTSEFEPPSVPVEKEIPDDRFAD